MSSPGDDTIRVGALLESSLQGCSSPEGCGSIFDFESELSKTSLWECLIKRAVSTLQRHSPLTGLLGHRHGRSGYLMLWTWLPH